MKIFTLLNAAIYIAGISVGVIIGMAYEQKWGKKKEKKDPKDWKSGIPDLDNIVKRLWERSRK